SAIAEELIECGYPVVSNDSLKVDASFIVRRLVSLLSCIENPSDEINKFIVKDTKVNIPSNYHSLTDLCEELLRQMQILYPEAFKNETLFIQSFMDELRERQADAGGGNLRYFLEKWKEKERSINSPENSNAINILTIHKAKGLEFPYLIFPFAEKVNIYKPSEKWCWLDASNSPFDSAVSGIYSVNLSEKSRDTLFAEAYDEERKMQLVDNLNLFYVALTRAKCCLHIIAANPAKSRMKEGKVIEYKNLSNILYNFCGGFSEKSYGSMYDFSRLERKEGKGEENFDAEYVSIDLAGRLKASEDALDFFGEDGVSVKEDSPRRSGVVLHDIMAEVKSLSDLEGAIKKALLDGRLDSVQAQDAQALLSERIRSREEFFDGSGYNEVPIFDSHGNEYRPDKVVISGRKAKIIDYKFGAPDKKYEAQVRTYMRLYREMGYEEVEGYLWYVMPDTLVPVQ
ncbi:MAG TPA: 3'-5' exonuclease, partial [Candidatus Cryptobacteroides sp.]|nr:3'-5' exonuclease [Candidatus Cryptobacteroides sp.]